MQHDVQGILDGANYDRFINDMRPFLRSISNDEWQRRFKQYRQSTSRPRTREQVAKALGRTLHPRDSPFRMPALELILRQGADLFRSRWIGSSSEIAVRADVWEAPAPAAKAGRLSTRGESLLYTALGTPATAVFESRIEPGELFAMARFRSKGEIRLARIAPPNNLKGLTLREEKNLTSIMDFLATVFNERAEPGDAYAYTAPEVLVKNYFDWPPEEFQGWAYQSVASPGGTGWNAAFRPEQAHDLLELVEVHICRLYDFDSLTQDVRFQALDILIPVPGKDDLVNIDHLVGKNTLANAEHRLRRHIVRIPKTATGRSGLF